VARKPGSAKHPEKEDANFDSGRLLRLREALGLTQRELAAEFGVTSGAVAHWELGVRQIAGPVQKLIAMYEEQLQGTSPKNTATEGWKPPETSISRGAHASTAMLIGIGLRIFGKLEVSPVARRVRLAAIKRYAKAIGGLRGLTMKIGQSFDYMSFLLPEEDREIFSAALKDIEPMSAATVAEVFAEQFGATPRQLFASWNPKPIAMASIGQVHRATLRDGRLVAVKVQYPRIAEALAKDLAKFRVLDQLYSFLFRGQKPGIFHEELRARVEEECNYCLEADHQKQFRALFSHRPDVGVPEVIAELSRQRVLTSLFAPGASFEEFVATASQAERDRAGKTLWEVFTESVFLHRSFNTDPHPGNLLFDADRVVFLDFGRVKRLTPQWVTQYKQVIRATMERDLDSLASTVIAMGSISDPTKFEVAHAYKTMVAGLAPWLIDGPFEFTADYAKQAVDAYLTSNPNLPVFNMTSDMPFVHLVQFGMTALLARLGARVECRQQMLDWLYPPGEQRPVGLSAQELRSLGLRFSGAR
jgi:DNA-binding XRE family transcriptional regulator